MSEPKADPCLKFYEMAKHFQRFAEAAQLRLEEKWLVNALAMIKQQRNCLQIELLHLDSKKLPLLRECASSEVWVTPIENENFNQPSTSGAEAVNMEPHNASGQNILEFEVSPEDTEIACNEEELDLAISKAILDQDDYDTEEYDEEESCENVFIDMNMLMNGIHDDREN